MTDEVRMCSKIGKEFAEHGTILIGIRQHVDYSHHTIHTNTVEGASSIFKRGMKGVCQDDGPERFKERLAKVLKHRPVEKPQVSPCKRLLRSA